MKYSAALYLSLKASSGNNQSRISENKAATGVG
jgi:hypothetical protein